MWQNLTMSSDQGRFPAGHSQEVRKVGLENLTLKCSWDTFFLGWLHATISFDCRTRFSFSSKNWWLRSETLLQEKQRAARRRSHCRLTKYKTRYSQLWSQSAAETSICWQPEKIAVDHKSGAGFHCTFSQRGAWIRGSAETCVIGSWVNALERIDHHEVKMATSIARKHC